MSVNRSFHLAALVLVPAIASAGTLTKSVKKAMLDAEGPVPVIIQWKPGGGRASLGGASLRELPLIRATAAHLDPARIQELDKDPSVEAIFHDGQVSTDEPAPSAGTESDVAAAEIEKGSTWGIRALGVDRVWKELGVQGDGVRVGVVDSGIDGLHPEFRNRLDGWADFTDDHSPEPIDGHGHGTHCAGTVLAGKDDCSRC